MGNSKDKNALCYLHRPGYNSDKWLIEISKGEDFVWEDFAFAIRELSPEITKNDIQYALRDEMWLEVKSNIGTITVEQDIWEFVWIDGENNEATAAIDRLLEASVMFKKKDADISKYRMH